MRKALGDPFLLALIALLAGFMVFKSRFLDLPFYWDEAWVYAPAAKAMYQQGLGLLPGAISPQLSRGHPLLFHFICGSWMHVFGASRISLHTFALAISICLLVLVYWVGARMGSKWIGLGAVVMILVNESFLAQSGILLPEILLAFLCLVTVHFYIERKALALVVAASYALMTKESAIILIATLFTWHAIRSLVAPDPGRRAADRRWVIILGVPLVPAFLFFAYQRHTFGWLFFPQHIGLMKWHSTDIIRKLKAAYDDLFIDQGRIWTTSAFALIAPIVWWGKDFRRSIPVVLLLIAASMVLFGNWPSWVTLLVPMVSFALVFRYMFLECFKRDPQRGEFICIAFIHVVLFMGSSAVNFFTDRYLMCVVPFVALGISAFLHSALNAYDRVLSPLVIGLGAGISLLLIGRTAKVTDTEMSYADAVDCELKLISFCEGAGLRDSLIYVPFLESVYMTDPGAGYLSGAGPFTRTTLAYSEETNYAVFSNSSQTMIYGERQRLGFTLLKRFESGPAWAEIHQRPSRSAR